MSKITTLHIGQTKTGSTSIQSCLAQNRDLLAQAGTLYSDAIGPINHNVITVFLQGSASRTNIQRKYNIKTDADYAAFTQSRLAAFTQDIAAHDPAQIIVSSEHMHSRCYTDAHFARLKTLLAPALTPDRDVRIIVYLRPQISHIISLYSTMLRHGSTQTLSDFITDRMTGRAHDYFDCHALLTRWAAAFPNAQLIVRPFNQMAGLPHGVVSDFIALTGLADLADDMVFEPRQNERMGAWAAEALRQLNLLEPALPRKLDRVARHWLRNEVQTGQICPDPVLARKFQASFAKGNAKVCKTYFGGDTSVFDVNWAKYDAQPDEHIGQDQLMTLLRQIANLT